MTMNPLIWYWGRRGGGAQYTAAVLEILAKQAMTSVTASLSTSIETRERIEKVATSAMFAKLHPPLDIRWLVPGPTSLGAYARRHHVDVVFHTMVNPLTPLGIRTLSRSMPLVTMVHDAIPHPGDEKQSMSRALDHALARSNRLIAASEHVKDQIRSLGIQTPIDVIGLPTLVRMPDCFDPAGKVLFFGRLLPYKGLRLLVDAWRSTMQENEATLMLAGEAPRQVDVACLRRPGIEIRNEWIPEDAIASLFAGTRLIVLPYLEASQSGIVPLAEAAGIPMLVTDVGGLRSQVGANALIVEPNEESLSRGLRAVLKEGRLQGLRVEAVQRRSSSSEELLADKLMTSLSIACKTPVNR